MAEKPMIPYSVRVEAYNAVLDRCPMLSTKACDQVTRIVLAIIESHMDEQEHITTVLKTVGDFPVEWESRPCYTFTHE